MPKYLIERNIPGAGSLDSDELRAASANSCSVLRELGPQIQWVQSYVTDDKITCVYISPSEEMIREHARRAGLPADAVMEIRTIIDPTTAEAPKTTGRATKSTGGVSAAVRSVPVLLAGLPSMVATACAPSSVEVVSPETAHAVVSAPSTSIHSAQPADADVSKDLAAAAPRRGAVPQLRDGASSGMDASHPTLSRQPARGWNGLALRPAYVDGGLDVTKPEALIYEPQEDGSMAFVGVEFAVPFAVLPPEAEAPELFGQTFLHNFGDELWMLHVWVGRHNPEGIFATWNPRVSCQHAD